MTKLNTSTPSGFPEFTPAQQRVVQNWKKTIAKVFELNGFPMQETPLVERAENFEAKGGNPKEIYVLDRMQREGATDEDKAVRALRFDHTVPLALFVARNFNELAFPFKRSVIGPVLRGERAQKGRFRQFDQCDIDVIGSEKLGLANDAQMVAIIAQIFEELMPEQKFVIRINNRKILMGQARAMNIDEKKFLDICDEREKVGEEIFNKKMMELCSDPEKIKLATDFMNFQDSQKAVDAVANNDWDTYWTEIRKIGGLHPLCAEGVQELETVVRFLINNLKIDKSIFYCDFGIARGLDYYTGTVYETNLLNEDGSLNTSLGSICSGGRYDDLAEVFTGKKLPGVGISIGLTRLLWQLFEAKLVDTTQATSSEVIVLSRDEKLLGEAMKIGAMLREQGIATEVYVEGKKIDKQIKFSQKLGIPCRVIVGEQDTQVESDNLELKMRVENLV